MSNPDNNTETRTEPENLTGAIDKLVEKTTGESVSLDNLMQVFNSRVFGPLLLIPSILAASPTGAIPGMSIITGAIIFTISTQLLFTQPHPWLPEKLLSYSFPRDKLKNSVEIIRPYTRKIDRYIKPRLNFLSKAPFLQFTALATMAMALLMFPLALVPFAVFLPALIIVIIALGLTSRDGVLLLLGQGLSVLVVAGTAILYAL